MGRLDEIKERKHRISGGFPFDAQAQDDVEWILQRIERLEFVLNRIAIQKNHDGSSEAGNFYWQEAQEMASAVFSEEDSK